MSNDINLLPKRKTTKSLEEKYKLLLKRGAIGLVVITILTTIIVFMLRITSPSQILTQNENSYLTSISFSQSKIAKLLFIKSRIKDINQLITNRNSYADMVSSIKNNLPQNVKIDALNITKARVDLTATSLTLSSLNDFLDKTVNILSIRPNFKKIIINNIVADEAARSYHITIESDYL